MKIQHFFSYLVGKFPLKVRIFAAWIIVYLLMVSVGHLLDLSGSDWYHHWQPRYAIDAYPPWVLILLAVLPGLPFLTGLTLTSLLYCLYARKARWFQVLAAFTALPLFGTLSLGQIDGVPMLGLTLLPWGLPLVLLKPQVAVWYLWVWWRKHPYRWKVAIGFIAFILGTFLIWGLWPLKFTQPAAFRSVFDLSLWKVHWGLGLFFLIGAILESDPDRAMALGALGAPYLQGISYMVLLPVFARLSGFQLVIAWFASWLGFFSLILGDEYRLLSILFPVTIWLFLAWPERKSWLKKLKPGISKFHISDGAGAK